jgi:hypothetical protein
MSEEMKETTINCETGEVTERLLTPEEVAQRIADSQRAETEATEREAQRAAITLAKESARAKLAALGLTAEEIAAL